MIYDKFAAGYDKILAPFEKLFLSKWRAETLAHLPENAQILEIGAGTGLNFEYYPRFRHAVAGEISRKMLEFAEARTATIDLLQTNAESLPFPEDYFDAAFATLVLCSVADPARAFAELRRVVKKRGEIILLEHVRPNGLLGIIFDVLNVFTVALLDDHFNRRTAQIAARAGLKIKSVEQKAFGAVNLIVCENEK